MPVFFFGHGSPMNAISDNAYTRMLGKVSRRVGSPKAILCVSAHWMTEGSWVTGMKNPRTIHDFYGFPEALFQVQYPAPGEPELAKALASTFKGPHVHIDQEMWGLDHGTWSVMRHLYPKAEIPVVQLSISMEHPPEYHYRLGQELRTLREQGILIIGSGNIVHNLRQIKWEENAEPYEWATEFDEWVKKRLEAGDHSALVNDWMRSAAGQRSVPTPDHYYPLLYVLGASDSKDQLRFEYEEVANGSISMRSFSYA